MSKERYFDIGFVGMLIALVAFHWGTLHLGHFWDEAWVYAPAVRHMGIHGPSLLPSGITLDYGRGHPLLFQFMGGVWTKLFGLSNASLHAYALSISCSLLIVVYVFLSKYFSRVAALVAVAFLLVQPFVLAQSAMVFPEMLLSLGFILALFAYVAEKRWLFMLGLSIAFYAKETALVFLVAFALWDLFRILFVRDRSWKTYLNYLLPSLVFLSHPLLTYLHYDWLFNPEHTGYVSTELQDVKYQFRRAFRILFEEQHRSYIVYGLVGLSVLFIRFKHYLFNLLLLAAGFSAYKIIVWKWPIEGPLFVVVMVAFATLPLFVWLKFRTSNRKGLTKIQNLLGLVYVTIIGFTVFSAMNFFTHRYLLVLIISLSVALSILVWHVIRLHWSWRLLMSLGVVGLGLHATITERTVSEVNLGLYDDLRLQHRLVDWVQEHYPRDVGICANFVTNTYLTNTKAGYVDSDDHITTPVSNACNPACRERLMIFTSTTTGCDDPTREAVRNSEDYRLVYSDTLGASRALVFERVD